MAYPNEVEWKRQPYLVIFWWDQKHLRFLSLSRPLESIESQYPKKSLRERPIGQEKKMGSENMHPSKKKKKNKKEERGCNYPLGTHGDKFEAHLGPSMDPAWHLSVIFRGK